MRNMTKLGALIGLAAVGAVAAATTGKAEAQQYNWTGLYFGVHAGGAWSGSDNSTANLFTSGFPGAGFFAPPNLPFDTGGNSLIGGVQVGYNWHVPSFPSFIVVGVEGDFSWTNINGSQTYNPIPLGPTGFNNGISFITMSRDVKWLSSVRGRIGYAWANVLLFATGGVAWSHADYNGIDSRRSGATVDTASLSSTTVGWVVGGGLEYAVASHWSIRGEYLYYNTPGVSAIAVQNPVCNPPSCTEAYSWDRNREHVARIAINYHF
jgi:outer membrane immunogenic protein